MSFEIVMQAMRRIPRSKGHLPEKFKANQLPALNSNRSLAERSPPAPATRLSVSAVL
jgi:hypothetical protein